MRNSPFVLFVATALAGGMVACSSSGPNSERDNNQEPDGAIGLALQAGGATINTVSYSITGPGGFSKSGSVDVSHSSTISGIISGLPTGTGFSITLTGTSVDGSLVCAGSATFNVTAHQTTPVNVPLDCHEAPRTGTLLVNGQLNVCPVVDGVSANPAEVLVGGSVALSGTAHDSDHAPSALTYQWSATSGVLTAPSSANTRFVCTAPGTATVTLTVSDGDATAGCPATSTVSVTCTAPTANTCALGNGAGPIKHFIYLQFDNVHLRRDFPGVQSDLEQMPHLLNFIRGNGTMMANDHTQLISHTSVGFLTSFTGVYPDRHGQTVGNSYVRTSPTGSFSFPSGFGYWTDPVSGTIPNMVAPDGSNFPAPWVPYTRMGCTYGAVGGANIVLENTSTSATGDVFKVFGTGSPQFAEAVTSNAAPSGSKARALAQTDFVGLAVHCAQGDPLCANGQNDLLPGEPGGYTGFKGLFGAQAINPVLTGSETGALNDLAGNPITDPFGQPGFPGFDGMYPAVSLAYVAALQEHGVPVTFGYISDAHDFHGVSGNAHLAYGPGEAGYVAQLQAYDAAFDAFFKRLAADGIDKSNTLFVITVDEGDHFVGEKPTNADVCDGPNTACIYTGTASALNRPLGSEMVGEVNANIDTLVNHQFPSLGATFLTAMGPDTFTVHGDDAPTFYLAKKGTGGGALGQTDPDTRNFERSIAGLTAFNGHTGMTDNVMVQMADQTGMKALHMITTGDPVRNATFTFFGNADYFITDFPASTCENCVLPGFAWNHGDIQPEIGQTWMGIVGPGVLSQPDQTVFTDHTDLRPTVNALLGLADTYQSDGRVITQAMVPAAVPAALAANQATVESLGDYYKRINAPFGQFAMDMLATSTKALSGSDPGDAIYATKEGSIAALTAQRDALVAQIRSAFDGAEFAGFSIDSVQAASWISQAQALLASADMLASAP
jgi:hypothetical protein